MALPADEWNPANEKNHTTGVWPLLAVWATHCGVRERSNLVPLGRRIKELRKERGLSQHELGERCDLSTNYIGLVERGERVVNLLALYDIAEALDVPMVALFQPQTAA